ncbi:MAG: SPFH domain-containing protein [bacterium]|nr:SPFH domain-containing protein [bacterium]
MSTTDNEYRVQNYVRRRKKLSGLIFETALPNEYLVRMGTGKPQPILGGRKLRFFGMRRYLRIPASVQTLEFATDNANIHFQGLGIEGFAAWQINAQNPVQALTTLDLFDENDPMGRTNHELRTICVEAVRHVIANMTIEDAHRKKEEIARELKKQLQQVEKNWGIVFHQVGIRSVKVMSTSVFHDLQAKYRNELRLESERTQVQTDREIEQEKNQVREVSEMERLATDHKLESASQEQLAKRREVAMNDEQRFQMTELQNHSELEKNRLQEEQNRKLQEQVNSSALHREELEGARETAELEHEVEQRRLELEVQRKRELELQLKELEVRSKEMEERIMEIDLKAERVQREISQHYSPEYLRARAIETLPKVAAEMKVDRYTVWDSGGAGGASVSPLSRTIQEVVSILGDSEFAGLFQTALGAKLKGGGESPEPSGKD